MNIPNWTLFLMYLIIEIRAVIISYTDKGVQCMSECLPYKGRDFCYLGWGSSNWDYCTLGKTESLQYYTSLAKGDNPKCSSICGKYGYPYNWCFTSQNGAWDYCNDKAGTAVTLSRCLTPCTREGNAAYKCKIGVIQTPASILMENPGLPWEKSSYDYCAPSPLNLVEFKAINQAILQNPGEYTSRGFHPFEHCRRTKRLSGNVFRQIGVEAIAARYERMYPAVIYNSPNVAVTSYTQTPAPPLRNHYDQTLTLVVRATIRFRHLNNPREHIPNYITQRMENMDALPGDERGHLLAASLGGPTHDFNFAPQTTRVNRASGGDSYWYAIEGDIRRFLQNNPQGYVTWTLVIAYGNLDTSRRPTGFALRFQQYNSNNVMVHDSGDCFFTNDPHGECDIV